MELTQAAGTGVDALAVHPTETELPLIASEPRSSHQSQDDDNLCESFDTQLTLDRDMVASRFHHQDTAGFFKTPYRSVSIDVGAIQHPGFGKNPAAGGMRNGIDAGDALNVSLPARLTEQLIFESDVPGPGMPYKSAHTLGWSLKKEGTLSPRTPVATAAVTLSTAPSEGGGPPFAVPRRMPDHHSAPLLRRYASSVERFPTMHPKDGVPALFSSVSSSVELDLGPSFRRTTARQNRSVESLRSKSWAQHTDNINGNGTPLDSYPVPRHQGGGGYYDVQRRFSYGWPADMGGTKQDCLGIKSRLATSHSYSDLNAVTSATATTATTTALQGDYSRLVINNDMSRIPSPQSQQAGICAPDNQCFYPHGQFLVGGDGPCSSPSPSLMSPTATMMPHPHAQTPPPTFGMYPSLSAGGTLVSPTLYLPYSTYLSSTPAHAYELTGKPAVRHASVPDIVTEPQRRLSEPPESSRFQGAKFEDFVGRLYELCKDQNGCRFLQKKLEEQDGKYIQDIFNETRPHFVELMTDPFGNYLCQKLVEKCEDSQRSEIVEIIAPDLLKVCLNMHGTRVVQKLVEHLSSEAQTMAVITAFGPNVVTLIKDLNGNHVIQKCLHRLLPEHNQFIYDTVSEHCIEVATHRHGCCVLQRCIDHATAAQKTQLVRMITYHALPLVQDPFGNYVVQYVLDLGQVDYTDALVHRFLEHVCDLSVQKFSSNVIEKCIRVSEPEARRALISEIILQSSMDKLLRDSFANYVIQTCLDYADHDQRQQLVENIRPLLPSIRSTPHGKRIYSKILRENQPHGHRHRQQVQYKNASFLPMASVNDDFSLNFEANVMANSSLYPY